MGHGARRQLAIGLVVAVMGTFVWSGTGEAFWTWYKLKQCRADLSTCDGDLATCDEELAQCEAQAPAGVPRTGQTGCWNSAGTGIDCDTADGAGQDGDVLAGVEWPDPRYTNNEDGTVTDNLTGLKWIEDWNCAALGGATGVNWATALTNANNLAHGDCGLTDGSVAGAWRLPNRFELESLLNLQFVNPAVSDTAGTGQWTAGDPFTDVQSAFYWSSSTDAGVPNSAWVVSFLNGFVASGGKAVIRRVLAVSGGGL